MADAAAPKSKLGAFLEWVQSSSGASEAVEEEKPSGRAAPRKSALPTALRSSKRREEPSDENEAVGVHQKEPPAAAQVPQVAPQRKTSVKGKLPIALPDNDKRSSDKRSSDKRSSSKRKSNTHKNSTPGEPDPSQSKGKRESNSRRPSKTETREESRPQRKTSKAVLPTFFESEAPDVAHVPEAKVDTKSIDETTRRPSRAASTAGEVKGKVDDRPLKGSIEASPKPSRKASIEASPKPSRKASIEASPKPSRKASTGEGNVQKSNPKEEQDKSADAKEARPRRRSIVDERIREINRKMSLGGITQEQDASEAVAENEVAEMNSPVSKKRESSRKSLTQRVQGFLSGSREVSLGKDESKEEVEPPATTREMTEQEDPTIAQDTKTPPPPPEKRPSLAGASNFNMLRSLFGNGKAVSNASKNNTQRESLLRLTEQNKSRTLARNAKSKSVKLPESATPTEEMRMKGVLLKSREIALAEEQGLEQVMETTVGEEPAEKPSGSAEQNEGDLEDAKVRKEAHVARVRSMNASPKCAVCNKTVYRMEKLNDSRDRSFHWDCLKCEDCPGAKSLSGAKVHVLERLEGEVPGKPAGKYVVCHTHHVMRQNKAEVVKGWVPDNVVNDGGIYEDDIEMARKSVRQSLAISMQRKPVCSRCGGEIEMQDKNFIVSGLERFHMQCPDPETLKKTPRAGALGAPDRMPVLLVFDANGKKNISFVFKLDMASKEVALRQHRLEPVRLRYVADTSSRAGAIREMDLSTWPKEDSFEVLDTKRTFREIRNAASGLDGKCHYDDDTGLIVSQLYKEDSGVIHGLKVAIGYDYEGSNKRATFEAVTLELTFELISADGYVDAASLPKEKPLVFEKDDFLDRVSLLA